MSAAGAEKAIGPEDQLARCVIYSKYFDDDKLSAHLLVPFNSKASPVISVYWRAIAKNNADVHRRGCKLAEMRNSRFEKKNGHPPSPGADRAYYCGYVQGIHRQIATNNTNWRTFAQSHPELDDDAHAHIVFESLQRSPDDHDLAVWMATASMHVAAQMRTAKEHRCNCDKNDIYHPRAARGAGYLTGRVA